MSLAFRRPVALAALAAFALMLAGTPGSAAAETYSERALQFKAAPGSKRCPVGPPALGGLALCGTRGFELTWDGKSHLVQTFAIGLDHAVYYLQRDIKSSPGWVSLGAWAKQGVFSEYVYAPTNLGIRTYGADSRRWCDNLYGTWGSWHLCAAQGS